MGFTRAMHLIVGRWSAPFLLALSLTGAALALEALQEGARPAPSPDLSVAGLVARLQRDGALERVDVTPAGAILATYDAPRRRVEIDAGDFRARPSAPPGRWLVLAREFHRSLGAGALGRAAVALTTAAALALVVSGWRRGLRPGPTAHRRLGLLVAAPLAVSAATGLALAATTLVPALATAPLPAFPAALAQGPPARAADLAALKAVPAGELEELLLPRADDPEPAYRLVTTQALAYVDAASGEIVAARDQPAPHRWARAALRLHAGHVSPLVALAFGLSAALTPFVLFSGLQADARARRRRRIAAAAPDFVKIAAWPRSRKEKP